MLSDLKDYLAGIVNVISSVSTHQKTSPNIHLISLTFSTIISFLLNVKTIWLKKLKLELYLDLTVYRVRDIKCREEGFACVVKI